MAAHMEQVARHYTRNDLLQAISVGVEQLGKDSEELTIEDLAPVDEFHIGGALATRAFLDQVGIRPEDHVLDLGCGIGGASRFAALTYGCRVTGIDLTAAYVETGRALCRWTGLHDRVRLLEGNALATALPAGSFDKVFLLHVGMNIPDKVALAREAWRVLRPGGVLGVYDVMRVGGGDLVFPVPWATVPSTSFVSSPDVYRSALSRAGFRLVGERNRRDFALRFFEGLRKDADRSESATPLGLHLLMGEDAALKIENMIENIAQGRVAPVEMIARRPD